MALGEKAMHQQILLSLAILLVPVDHGKNNVKQALADAVQANSNMQAPQRSRLVSWNPVVHVGPIYHCQRRPGARSLP
jgi:hypothetical protein